MLVKEKHLHFSYCKEELLNDSLVKKRDKKGKKEKNGKRKERKNYKQYSNQKRRNYLRLHNQEKQVKIKKKKKKVFQVYLMTIVKQKSLKISFHLKVVKLIQQIL